MGPTTNFLKTIFSAASSLLHHSLQIPPLNSLLIIGFSQTHRSTPTQCLTPLRPPQKVSSPPHIPPHSLPSSNLQSPTNTPHSPLGPTLLHHRPRKQLHLPHHLRPGRPLQILQTRPQTHLPNLHRPLRHQKNNLPRRPRPLRRNRPGGQQDESHVAGCGVCAAEEGDEGGVLAEAVEGE